MNTTNKLKPFYITFGSDEKFPYPKSYIIVPAITEQAAVEKFREKYPDRYPNTYNFSEIYSKEQWLNGISKNYGDIPAEILGVSQKAIDYINAFCQEEFESDADFSDPEAIGVFYTTVDYESEMYHDLEIELQNNVNLIDMSIERYLQNILFEKQTFDTEEDFLWALENLNESDLVYVSEEQFVSYHRARAIEYLAKTESSAAKDSPVTETNPHVFNISFDLEEMVKSNLIFEDYQPTAHTVKEVFDYVYRNPFNLSNEAWIKAILRSQLVKEIENAIACLDKPEIQNKKGQAVEAVSAENESLQKGDRVKILGIPKDVFATVIRKGHKNHWVINIDGDAKNVEFNEKSLQKVK